MRNALVYDMPLRIFHWLFSGLFLVAYVIAKTQDSEGALFAFHMLAGLTLGFLLVFRAAWGLFGTRHSRWSSFPLSPKDLLGYFRDLFTKRAPKSWVGHNPASSWASLAMLGCGVGLVVTGFLMAQSGDAELYEDAHELFANVFLVTAIFHVLGVVLHSIRHRDAISLSMVDGKKQNVTPSDTISTSKGKLGLLLGLATSAFVFGLVQNYDSTTRKLQFFGTTLQLGEAEDNEGESKSENASGEKEDKEQDEGDDD